MVNQSRRRNTKRRKSLEDFENHWGLRLSSVLMEKKVSKRQAAKAAGVAASVIDSWVGGATPGDLKAIKRLCDSLAVSFVWLLTGDDDSRARPTMVEMFDTVPYFDGYARIKIDRLIPRKKNNDND